MHYLSLVCYDESSGFALLDGDVSGLKSHRVAHVDGHCAVHVFRIAFPAEGLLIYRNWARYY